MVYNCVVYLSLHQSLLFGNLKNCPIRFFEVRRTIYVVLEPLHVSQCFTRKLTSARYRR